MFRHEGIINKLVEDAHKLWKRQREQFELLEPALEGQLLLEQLNSSHRLLRV